MVAIGSDDGSAGTIGKATLQGRRASDCTKQEFAVHFAWYTKFALLSSQPRARLLLLLSAKPSQSTETAPTSKATGEVKRTSLIESAEATATEGGGEAMRRWVDRRLKDSFPVDAAEGLTTLALRCVAKETAARPDMPWVAANVSKLFLESRDWADKFRFPTDISISIAPR
ncbi:hypothetical protein GUJ93_ZPchr0007g6021 [Zizania palustris]|uniref:Uncharacterized protein n=1 Tax=Zizania palustris TaxID=103762 RepID=A0A8J5TJ50_ZIZPA|nr:hypothetical protein GUJ93_ZPchr0007g6021 [Zizania palustris]